MQHTCSYLQSHQALQSILLHRSCSLTRQWPVWCFWWGRSRTGWARQSSAFSRTSKTKSRFARDTGGGRCGICSVSASVLSFWLSSVFLGGAIVSVNQSFNQPSICLSMCYQSVYLSIRLFTYLTINLSVYSSIYLSTYLPVYQSIYLYVCLSINNKHCWHHKQNFWKWKLRGFPCSWESINRPTLPQVNFYYSLFSNFQGGREPLRKKQ